MRYFHRTSLGIDDALRAADAFFKTRLETVSSDAHERTYGGPIGQLTVHIRADGGHYTLLTVTTDQVGESELDKQAKRFLGTIHTKVHTDHALRGAY
jgi:hypothetical protein